MFMPSRLSDRTRSTSMPPNASIYIKLAGASMMRIDRFEGQGWRWAAGSGVSIGMIRSVGTRDLEGDC